MKKTYNILITGVGGQGLITILQLLSQAAMARGFEVRTSELHGLSQRGGSVMVHIRFGQKIFSPMLSQASADLILALETQEALAGLKYASSKTSFLVNQYQTPTLGETISESEVKKALAKVSKKVKFIPASQICQKELGRDVTAGIFLLALAVHQQVIPLTLQDLTKAIKRVMPEKYWDLNLKTLDLAASARSDLV